MGLVMGSIFFGSDADEINNKIGVQFCLGGMAQLPAAIDRKQQSQVRVHMHYAILHSV
jgi:iron-sulfur cluster repair protein YtfE (RIC family)